MWAELRSREKQQFRTLRRNSTIRPVRKKAGDSLRVGGSLYVALESVRCETCSGEPAVDARSRVERAHVDRTRIGSLEKRPVVFPEK